MTEREFQTAFTKWAKHNIRTNTACELKVTKSDRFPFANIKDHQWLCLANAKHRTLSYKIPDVGYDQKPCDMMILSGAEAYFVIMFYTHKGVKDFCMIDIDVMLRMREAGYRSLTKDEAYGIADKFGELL